MARLISEQDVSISFLASLLAKGIITEEHITVIQNYDTRDIKNFTPSASIRGFKQVKMKGKELEDYIDQENRLLTSLGNRWIIKDSKIGDFRKITRYQTLNGELLRRIAINIVSKQCIEAIGEHGQDHIAKFTVTSGCETHSYDRLREWERVIDYKIRLLIVVCCLIGVCCLFAVCLKLIDTEKRDLRHTIVQTKCIPSRHRGSNIFGISETHHRAAKQTVVRTEQGGSRESGKNIEGAMNQLLLPFKTIDEDKQTFTDLYHIVRTNKLINAMLEIIIRLKYEPLIGVLITGSIMGYDDNGDLEKHVADITSKSTDSTKVQYNSQQSTFSEESEEIYARQSLSTLNPFHDSHSKRNSYEFFYRRNTLQLQGFDFSLSTNEVAFLRTKLPYQIESPEFVFARHVASDLTLDIFGRGHDELECDSFQFKEELMKSNNIIIGNGWKGCSDVPVHPTECVNPNGLKEELLPRTTDCQSNTTSWQKLTSNSTTRILNFCRSTSRLSISHVTPYQLGLKSCSLYTWLFFGMFLLLMSASTAEQQLSVMDGQSLRLHCSVNSSDSVKWLHEYVGTGRPNYVYYADHGLMGQYRSGGRHSIVNGTSNLLIKNVTDSDAGKYTCEKTTALEEHVDVYDIVILKSMPTCRSNIDLADVIGENDCDIDPDLLRLHCSVVYSGNFAPRLHWQNSEGAHFMIGTNVSVLIRDGANHSTESILTVTANMRLNYTYFTCQVADSQSDDIEPGCRTDALIVHSLYNSSVMPEINMKSQKEISCTSNSSQPCNYQWIHQYEKYKIAINGSTLTFKDVSLGDGIYECQAECRLSGQICLTMPLRITVVAGGMNNSDETVGRSALEIALIVSNTIFFAFSIALLHCLLIYKRRNEKRREYERKLYDT